MSQELDVYGLSQPKEKTGGKEYFGFSLDGTEEYYQEIVNDMEKIRKKVGLAPNAKKMLLLASIKLAVSTIK